MAPPVPSGLVGGQASSLARAEALHSPSLVSLNLGRPLCIVPAFNSLQPCSWEGPSVSYEGPKSYRTWSQGHTEHILSLSRG